MYTRGMAHKAVIAHVGAYKRRTDGDIGRWLMALDWLMKNDALPTGFKHEVINLKYGRDFLTENNQYDIVVLHDIFDAGNKDIVSKIPKRVRQAIETSPYSSNEWWRLRLEMTYAKYIFVFETAPCCINGWGLGNLKDYETVYIDHQYAVYRRLEV